VTLKPKEDSSVTAPKGLLQRPFSPASERNREPILEVLRIYFRQKHRVLEIGSGTGQHAVYFGQGLPHLLWQASDRADNLPGIRLWLDEANLENTPAPITLDVKALWPTQTFDGLFTANTLHIMAWPEIEAFFEGMDHVLTEDAVGIIYGPFNRKGKFTSPSNAQFDAWLKSQAPHQGIRDLEAILSLAEKHRFELLETVDMPSNNQSLIFQRRRANLS